MGHERFPRNIEPTVQKPVNPPPCTDFITAIPMSVIIDVSLQRSHLTLVKTTHEETILKVQKTYVKISTLRYRSWYRIYSEKGKELILSNDKQRRWVITWPNEPHKECRIVEHSSYCDAVFSDSEEDSIRFEMHSDRRNIFTNTATGKVFATAHNTGFWRTRVVMAMDKNVDVLVMTALIVAATEIIAADSGGGAMGFGGGGC